MPFRKPHKPFKVTPLIAKTHIFIMFLNSWISPFPKSRTNFELHNLYAICLEIPDVTSARCTCCTEKHVFVFVFIFTGRLICCRSFASSISWIPMSILLITIPVLRVTPMCLKQSIFWPVLVPFVVFDSSSLCFVREPSTYPLLSRFQIKFLFHLRPGYMWLNLI